MDKILQMLRLILNLIKYINNMGILLEMFLEQSNVLSERKVYCKK